MASPVSAMVQKAPPIPSALAPIPDTPPLSKIAEAFFPVNKTRSKTQIRSLEGIGNHLLAVEVDIRGLQQLIPRDPALRVIGGDPDGCLEKEFILAVIYTSRNAF